jgi:hypothetical protein
MKGESDAKIFAPMRSIKSLPQGTAGKTPIEEKQRKLAEWLY